MTLILLMDGSPYSVGIRGGITTGNYHGLNDGLAAFYRTIGYARRLSLFVRAYICLW